MSAPYPNSERPGQGKILGIYFTKDELDHLEVLRKQTGLKRNTLVRQIVREYQPE